MKNKLILHIYFLIVSCSLAAQTPVIDEADYPDKIRVACIGNSVTFGYGLEDTGAESYPARLQDMLGEKYDVRNFGFSGATLLNKGHKPYREKAPYREALAFRPHIVVIHLGLNDTDPRNWARFGEEFIGDYRELIADFRSIDAEPAPRVWICKMTPIFSWHRRFQSGTREDFRAIQEAIEQVAEKENITLVDLHTPLYARPDLFDDALHPSAEGAEIIASTVRSSISGDFGGLSLSPMFTDHMVLQRDRPVRISGRANAGEVVSISFAGKEIIDTADAGGHWMAEFPPMKAGGPHELLVSAGKTIQIRDILVGEVWLCSGQSNMAFPLEDEKHFEKEIDRTSLPEIRLFNFNATAWPSSRAFTREEMEDINRGDYFVPGPWKRCSPETVSGFSAVAYYFGRELYERTGVPIGLIHNAVGGSSTESWISRLSLEFHPEFTSMLEDWLYNEQVQPWCRMRAAENLQDATSKNQQHPFAPSYLFTTGIVPLKDFGIRGVIWYQGESNAEQIKQHEELFSTLVRDWRSYLKNQEMPFYYVQLSSLNRETWPAFRDSQRRLMSLIPNTGMAVCSDIGHPTDVHPRNKKDVGLRLSLWALAEVYGQPVEYSGPLFNSMKKSGNKIKLYFDHADSGLATSDKGEIRGFEIAGKDGSFVPAIAKIRKNHVIVSGLGVSKPEFVRYAWTPYSDGNLINKAALPASTFHTGGKY